MGCNAGLGRDGHAMVTRKAASQQAAMQQAAVESELSQSVQAHVRGSLEHGQRMRNNSNSYSNSYSNSDSASARTIDWGATLPSTVVCGRDASPNQIGPPIPGSALRGET
jgi:hypothetical protein